LVLVVLHATTPCTSGNVVCTAVRMSLYQVALRVGWLGSSITPYSAIISGLGRWAAHVYQRLNTVVKLFHCAPGLPGAKL
jgi:hypothetical protein